MPMNRLPRPVDILDPLWIKELAPSVPITGQLWLGGSSFGTRTVLRGKRMRDGGPQMTGLTQRFDHLHRVERAGRFLRPAAYGRRSYSIPLIESSKH
jgi:hypothetical protein